MPRSKASCIMNSNSQTLVVPPGLVISVYTNGAILLKQIVLEWSTQLLCLHPSRQRTKQRDNTPSHCIVCVQFSTAHQAAGCRQDPADVCSKGPFILFTKNVSGATNIIFKTVGTRKQRAFFLETSLSPHSHHSTANQRSPTFLQIEITKLRWHMHPLTFMQQFSGFLLCIYSSIRSFNSLMNTNVIGDL